MELAKTLGPVGLETIEQMGRDAWGSIDHIYLHWTAGHYGQIYDDYHISVDYDGRIYLPGNDRRLWIKRNHTWRRNSRSVGIAACCCFNAAANNGIDCDFGPNPITAVQVEAMALIVAALNRGAGIPITPDDVMTHYEAACNDGYGVPYGTWVNGVYQCDSDCRWDLWYLPDYDGQMRNGGDVLRGKANWYASLKA